MPQLMQQFIFIDDVNWNIWVAIDEGKLNFDIRIECLNKVPHRKLVEVLVEERPDHPVVSLSVRDSLHEIRHRISLLFCECSLQQSPFRACR
jgi:hypothetical protein